MRFVKRDNMLDPGMPDPIKHGFCCALLTVRSKVQRPVRLRVETYMHAQMIGKCRPVLPGNFWLAPNAASPGKL
jgi:hypothetical protein